MPAFSQRHQTGASKPKTGSYFVHVPNLENEGIEYTVSVLFERLLVLKGRVEKRQRWSYLDGACDYFQLQRKPKSWKRKRRFVVVRQASKVQQK